MKRRPVQHLAVRYAIPIAVLNAFATTTFAGPLYWDGGTTNLVDPGNGQSDGGNGSWTLSLKNFDQGVGQNYTSWTNTIASTGVFGGTAGVVTITAASGISAVGINFLTSGYTIATDATTKKLTLSGTGTESASAIYLESPSVTSTISAPIVLGAPANSTQTWSIASGSTLNLSGAVSTQNSSTLSLAGGGVINTSGSAFIGSLLVSGGTTLNVTSSFFTANGSADTIIGNGSAGTLNATGAFAINATTLLAIGSGNGAQGVLNVKGSTTTAAYGLIRVGTGTLSTPSNSVGTITISNGVFETGDAAANTAPLSSRGFFLGNNGSGSGTINLDGGTLRTNLVIQRDDSYTATTAGLTKGSVINFNGGTLQATGTGTSIATNVTANVRNGGAIIDTSGFSVTIPANLRHSALSGDAAIDGGLTKSGSGTLILTGANTYTGPTNVNTGILQIGTGGTVGSIAGNTISLAPGAQLSVNRTDTLDLASSISGSGSIRIDGVGGLKLSNTNNYSGGTTVGVASTLIAGANNAFGTGPVTASFATTLQAAGAARTLASGLNMSGTGVTVSGDHSLTINGTINGANGENRTIVNNLSASPNNATLTLGGTINITTGNGNRTLTMTTSPGQTTMVTGTIVNGGTSTGSNFAVDGGGTTILTNSNSYGGTTSVSTAGSVLQVGNGGTSGSLSNGPIAVSLGKISFARSNTVNLPNDVSGSGSLEQAGTGKLIVSGSHIYTGGTTISSGTLVANGSASLGTRGASVNAGGTLAGIGTITNNLSNAVSINNGGTITAGTGTAATDQVGTLTVNNQQAWMGGGAYAFKIAATTGSTTPASQTGNAGVYWDKLVMGSLTMTGASTANKFVVRVINASGGGAITFLPGAKFQIARINGDLTSFNLNKFILDTSALALNPALFSVESATSGGLTDLLLSFNGASAATSSPEPTTTLLVGLGGGAILTSRRRRAIKAS